MKHTLKVAAAVLGLTGTSAFAAYDIAVQNFDAATVAPGSGNPSGIPILDNSGQLLASGLTYVGTFPTTGPNVPNFAADSADTLFSKMILAGAALMQPPVNVGIELPGLFSGIVSSSGLPNDGSGALFGQQIYTLVADTTGAIDSSTLVVVLSNGPGETFGKENAAGQGGQSVNYFDEADVVYGTIVQGPFDPGGAGAFNFAVGGQVISVPEPSASLLAGLAGLALLIRRRR